VLFSESRSSETIAVGRASSSLYGAAGALIILMFVHVLFGAKLFGAELTKTIPDGRAPADRQAQRGTIHQSESSFLTKNR
jgi:uncharacterized BrkB/YihY/UPF0761 family membrane protein